MDRLLFPDAPIQVTLDRQIECVQREIKKRESVYPRLVAAGKITQRLADTEIACMKAVLDTLRICQSMKAAP